MTILSMDDLIDRIKTLPQNKAKQQMRWYLLSFIGDTKKGDILRNRFKREMYRKVEEQK